MCFYLPLHAMTPAVLSGPFSALDDILVLRDLPEQLQPLLCHIRRALHQYPELGMEEVQTSAFIRLILESFGLHVVTDVAKTGLYVDIHGAHPGPAIGYRADMDALPTQDRKTAPYRSTQAGKGHLCGHDAHTAIAIGVALLLHERRSEFCGMARVFFQPNEEGMPSGAPMMIRDGVLDGLEAVYAIHVDPTLSAGTYGLTAGPLTASADQFSVFVEGPASGHSARPHQSADTVWIAVQVMQALYQLVGRITDSRNAAILTLCRLFGGEAFNVIPQRVEFGGTLRCANKEDRRVLGKKITEVAEATASLYGATAHVAFVHGAPPVVNDGALIDRVRQLLLVDHGEEAIFEIPLPSMGGEDFAHYLDQIPGAMIRVGTAAGPASEYPLHHACFDIDEATLATTATLMARVMEAFLQNKPGN